MKQIFSIIILAIKKVLARKKYLALFAILSSALLFLSILIPVLAIPGNDFLFQLSIFSKIDYALMIFLSLLSSLFITMQVYGIRVNRQLKKEISRSGISGLGAVGASVLATVSCPSCIAGLFGLFGIGLEGTLLLVEYRNYIFFTVTAIIFISLYYSCKKVLGICNGC